MFSSHAMGVALLVAFSAISCQAPAPSDPGRPFFRGEEVQPDEFTLVFLLTGAEPPELSDSERASAFDGHFEFMGELAAAGTLLVAGPFGSTRAEADLRGLFVLDGESVDACAALAAQDPTTQLGIFRQQAFSLMVPDMVRRLPEMYGEFEAARAADGHDPSVPVLADYVVMVAQDGKSAFQACNHGALLSKVVLLGRMGEPMEGALFGVFDATDPAEIRARLTVAGCDLEGLELSQWMGSPVLRDLARAPAVGDPD